MRQKIYDEKAKRLEDAFVKVILTPSIENMDELVIVSGSCMRQGVSIYGTSLYDEALKNALFRINGLKNL